MWTMIASLQPIVAVLQPAFTQPSFTSACHFLLAVEPFGGAFTGAAACKTLGNRRYVGCDIEEKWVQVGIDRLARMSQETEADEDWGDTAQNDDEDWAA